MTATDSNAATLEDWRLLGLPRRTATAAEVQHAYRLRARAIHPDAARRTAPDSTAAFMRLVAVRDRLLQEIETRDRWQKTQGLQRAARQDLQSATVAAFTSGLATREMDVARCRDVRRLGLAPELFLRRPVAPSAVMMGAFTPSRSAAAANKTSNHPQRTHPTQSEEQRPAETKT